MAVEVLEPRLEQQVDRLATRLSSKLDGDKPAESLLSLLGLLKNGKKTDS